MKKLIVLSGVLISGVAFANPPATGATAATGNGGNADPNQMVCMNIAETGSRLSHTRVCMTRAQWDAQRRLQRQDIERAQNRLNPNS